MRKLCLLLLLFLVLTTPYTLIPKPCLYAADLAQFQLLIPAPDPAPAGETLTIQMIVANTGAETWLKGSYEYEAEIYDKEKKYLLKTGRTSGDKDLATGESDLRFISFGIPTQFLGIYYFRMGVYYKGQRVAYSDFQRFTVTPLVIVPREIPKVKIGGNTILSYRNEPKNMVGSYTGNISVNLLGSIYQRAVVFNLYTNHTPEKPAELYNILLNYYSDNLDVAAGDIMPSFSPLALSNTGVRGINPTVKYGLTNTSLVVARSIEPKEGTSATNGVYGRSMYGLNERINLPLESYVNLSYVTNSDDYNSILVKGPSMTTALKNDVAGIGFKTSPISSLALTGDYSQSGQSTDTVKNTGAIKDYAYKLGMENTIGGFTARAGYQFVGSNFNSVGSPTVVKDRISQDIFTGMRVSRVGSISVSYMQYNDNIATPSDKAKAITLQKIYSVNMGLYIPKIPLVSLGVSKNDIAGKPTDNSTVNILENNTSLVSAGVAYTLKKVTISVSTQKSLFIDTLKTTKENDRDTASMSFGLTFMLDDRLSMNIGDTNSSVTRGSDSLINVSNSVSLTANYKMIKDKLTASVWGNSTARTDKYPSAVITGNTAMNTEFTYYFSQQFSWTLGGGMTRYTDDLNLSDATKNYTENRYSTRASIGF